MVLHAFLRSMSSMPDQIKKDRARSNKKKDEEQTPRPNAEVIDWFLAIDVIHVL